MASPPQISSHTLSLLQELLRSQQSCIYELSSLKHELSSLNRDLPSVTYTTTSPWTSPTSYLNHNLTTVTHTTALPWSPYCHHPNPPQTFPINTAFSPFVPAETNISHHKQFPLDSFFSPPSFPQDSPLILQHEHLASSHNGAITSLKPVNHTIPNPSPSISNITNTDTFTSFYATASTVVSEPPKQPNVFVSPPPSPPPPPPSPPPPSADMTPNSKPPNPSFSTMLPPDPNPLEQSLTAVIFENTPTNSTMLIGEEKVHLNLVPHRLDAPPPLPESPDRETPCEPHPPPDPPDLLLPEQPPTPPDLSLNIISPRLLTPQPALSHKGLRIKTRAEKQRSNPLLPSMRFAHSLKSLPEHRTPLDSNFLLLQGSSDSYRKSTYASKRHCWKTPPWRRRKQRRRSTTSLSQAFGDLVMFCQRKKPLRVLCVRYPHLRRCPIPPRWHLPPTPLPTLLLRYLRIKFSIWVSYWLVLICFGIKKYLTCENKIMQGIYPFKVVSVIDNGNLACLLGFYIDSICTALIVYEYPANRILEEHTCAKFLIICSHLAQQENMIKWHYALEVDASEFTRIQPRDDFGFIQIFGQIIELEFPKILADVMTWTNRAAGCAIFPPRVLYKLRFGRGQQWDPGGYLDSSTLIRSSQFKWWDPGENFSTTLASSLQFKKWDPGKFVNALFSSTLRTRLL